MTAWTDDVLHFWFDHIGPEHWYGGGPEVDAEITERFEPLWHSLKKEKAIFFVTSPLEALAAVILFDQFPRNMFRHQPDAFATDALALSIAKLSIETGFDTDMTPEQRQFLYMPFQHSEDIADQDMSAELFDGLGLAEPMKFAIAHRDIIKRFGRFPHRNEVLGRETLPEEVSAIEEGEHW